MKDKEKCKECFWYPRDECYKCSKDPCPLYCPDMSVCRKCTDSEKFKQDTNGREQD